MGRVITTLRLLGLTAFILGGGFNGVMRRVSTIVRATQALSVGTIAVSPAMGGPSGRRGGLAPHAVGDGLTEGRAASARVLARGGAKAAAARTPTISFILAGTSSANDAIGNHTEKTT